MDNTFHLHFSPPDFGYTNIGGACGHPTDDSVDNVILRDYLRPALSHSVGSIDGHSVPFPPEPRLLPWPQSGLSRFVGTAALCLAFQQAHENPDEAASCEFERQRRRP